MKKDKSKDTYDDPQQPEPGEAEPLGDINSPGADPPPDPPDDDDNEGDINSPGKTG